MLDKWGSYWRFLENKGRVELELCFTRGQTRPWDFCNHLKISRKTHTGSCILNFMEGYSMVSMTQDLLVAK